MLLIRNNSIMRGVDVLRWRRCFPVAHEPTGGFLRGALKRPRCVVSSWGVAAEDGDT